MTRRPSHIDASQLCPIPDIDLAFRTFRGAGPLESVTEASYSDGAGMVNLSVPGALLNSGEHEYVQRPFPASNWAKEATASLDRFQSLVIGPGLGRDEATVAAIRTVVQNSPVPTVVDGDGLFRARVEQRRRGLSAA